MMMINIMMINIMMIMMMIMMINIMIISFSFELILITIFIYNNFNNGCFLVSYVFKSYNIDFL
jgi:hypothetical protein